MTVAAGSCVGADVAAKAAYLLSDNGPDWLDGRALPGRFLAEDDLVENEAWLVAAGGTGVALASTVLTWYVARAGGLLAFALVSASVILGLALAGRVRSTRWPAFAIEDVHRYVGLLAGAFIAIHGLALLVDGYVNFDLGALLVPGAAPTRVVPVAFGVIAAELLAALAVTNHYRRRIPHHVWRRLHYGNFAVWALALVHGITAGTDTSSTWVVVMYAVSARGRTRPAGVASAANACRRAMGAAPLARRDRRRRRAARGRDDARPARDPRRLRIAAGRGYRRAGPSSSRHSSIAISVPCSSPSSSTVHVSSSTV